MPSRCKRLAELPLAAVVIDGRYAAVSTFDHVDGGWLADQLVRLQAPATPKSQLVFTDGRRHGGDWTHRFLTTALPDAAELHATH